MGYSGTHSIENPPAEEIQEEAFVFTQPCVSFQIYLQPRKKWRRTETFGSTGRSKNFALTTIRELSEESELSKKSNCEVKWKDFTRARTRFNSKPLQYISSLTLYSTLFKF